MLTSMLAARLVVPRLGVKGMLPLGVAVQAVGFVTLAQMTVSSSYAAVALPGVIVYGIGVGLTLPVAFNGGMREVPASHAGLSATVLDTAQQIGMTFGAALLTAYITGHFSDYVARHKAALKAGVASALGKAHAGADSATGLQIVHRLTVAVTVHAQIHAYSAGLALYACILGGAVVLLLIATLVYALSGRPRTKPEVS